MTDLNVFNSYLRERLSVFAEEIFQAVQDIVCEQQNELQCAKEEIENLRAALTEAHHNKTTDALTNHPAELALEQEKNVNETSLFQVKLELCADEQDAEPHQSDTSMCSSSSPKITDIPKVTPGFPPRSEEAEALQMNSYLAVSLVPCDAQLNNHNQTSNVLKNQTVDEWLVQELRQEDSHPCPYCRECFGDLSQLASHLENHKGVIGRFYCHICDRRFKYYSSWKNHMMVHQKLRPFRCNFCAKGFNQNGHLKEHLRIHTGEKPFNCSICGKGFTQFNHVRLHIRNYHRDVL